MGRAGLHNPPQHGKGQTASGMATGHDHPQALAARAGQGVDLLRRQCGPQKKPPKVHQVQRIDVSPGGKAKDHLHPRITQHLAAMAQVAANLIRVKKPGQGMVASGMIEIIDPREIRAAPCPATGQALAQHLAGGMPGPVHLQSVHPHIGVEQPGQIRQTGVHGQMHLAAGQGQQALDQPFGLQNIPEPGQLNDQISVHGRDDSDSCPVWEAQNRLRTESGAKSHFAPDRGQRTDDRKQKALKTTPCEFPFVPKMLVDDFLH